MHGLMLMLASVMPEEMILTEMSEALTAYKMNPSPETKQKLTMTCMLFASKNATEQNPKGAMGMLDDMDKVDKAMKLMNPGKN